MAQAQQQPLTFQQYPPSNPYQQQPYGGPPAAYRPGGAGPPAMPYNSTTTRSRRPEDVEMGSLVQQAAPSPYSNNSSAPSSRGDMHAIMDECRRITDEAARLDARLSTLQTAQMRSMNDPNDPAARHDLDDITADINSTYKALIQRLKYVKTRPESNAPMNKNQIGLADRQLREAWSRYKLVENTHSRRMREQIERQYRITRPDATEEETRAATDDPDAQIFAQAIMNSNRRGESRQVLGAVRERHEAIAKIERQMAQLGELFRELAETVAVQEPMVQNIEKSAVETHSNVEQGVGHLIPAVKSARAARKKKWICLGLTVLIIVVLIIVLLIVLKVVGVIH